MDLPGAPWLKIPYEEQLERKKELLRNAFHREVPMTPNPQPLKYRNHLEAVCTPTAVGFRKQGDWSTVIDLDEHPLASDRVNDIYKEVREWIAQAQVPCMPINSNTGWLRYVHVRAQEESQVAISTRTALHEPLVQDLWTRLDVDSLVWIVTSDDEATAQPHKVFGEERITLELAGKSLLVDPQTFFQASTKAASLAVERMREHVDGNLLELFCGVGALGIALEPDHLTGVEIVEASVEAARRNAELNQQPADFIAMDAASYLPSHPVPGTVLVDPPRTGLTKAAPSLLAAAPKRIIYLSCNPLTQARDLALLKTRYRIAHLEGFDFFPQTPHVECLAILERDD